MNRTFLLILAAILMSGGLLLVLSLKPPQTQDGKARQMSVTPGSKAEVDKKPPAADVFAQLLSGDPQQVDQALAEIRQGWHPGSTTMLFELARIARSVELLQQISWLAEEKTGQSFGTDMKAWGRWVWDQEYQPHPQYAEFKSLLYSRIDPSFAKYFESTSTALIRLDEIVWGGVKRDGIPPLEQPVMIAAGQATWLDNGNEVFGLVINGDARCYPRRILAWHEMFKDTVGGVPVCGVY